MEKELIGKRCSKPGEKYQNIVGGSAAKNFLGQEKTGIMHKSLRNEKEVSWKV